MTKIEMIQTVKELDLPKDKYAVLMGGSLCAHGLRDAGDVDIIFDKSLKSNFLEKGFKSEELVSNGVACTRYSKGNIEAFDYFLHVGFFDANSSLLKDLSIIAGIPFLGLKSLLTVKSMFGREKDLKDIATISTFMSYSGA